MKGLIPILDNGHGGVIGGRYQTAGKRSPNWEKGVLYEGAFNRWIVARIMQYLDEVCVPYYHISPELEDITLGERVRRANDIYTNVPKAYLLSIHANAGGGEGIEGFTHEGLSDSDKIVERILQDIKIRMTGLRLRVDLRDGDMDKEAGFYLLKYSNCPAGLLELGFMDNRKDYARLWDRQYQDDISSCIAKTITDMYYGQE